MVAVNLWLFSRTPITILASLHLLLWGFLYVCFFKLNGGSRAWHFLVHHLADVTLKNVLVPGAPGRLKKKKKTL